MLLDVLGVTNLKYSIEAAYKTRQLFNHAKNEWAHLSGFAWYYKKGLPSNEEYLRLSENLIMIMGGCMGGLRCCLPSTCHVPCTWHDDDGKKVTTTARWLKHDRERKQYYLIVCNYDLSVLFIVSHADCARAVSTYFWQ